MKLIFLLGVLAALTGILTPDPVGWPSWGDNTLWLCLGANSAFLIRAISD
jgi:hypothetical protein